MSDYPLIDPADVREGDEIEVTYRMTVADGLSVSHIGLIVDHSTLLGEPIKATDLRLVHRPAPPEPALRVGDWVRVGLGNEGQIDEVDDENSPTIFYVPACHDWYTSGQITRIEPPVGWPVAVPDPDAPGGVRWWVRDPGGEYRGHHDGKVGYLEWPDLAAAGGVPALAPEPTP